MIRRMWRRIAAYGARPHESRVTAVVYGGVVYSAEEWSEARRRLVV